MGEEVRRVKDDVHLSGANDILRYMENARSRDRLRVR